jgi:hypothetical protein
MMLKKRGAGSNLLPRKVMGLTVSVETKHGVAP